MPMSYSEMKNTIIHKYNASNKQWYEIVGNMFEVTNGFTKQGTIAFFFETKTCCIDWDNYSWSIEEI